MENPKLKKKGGKILNSFCILLSLFQLFDTNFARIGLFSYQLLPFHRWISSVNFSEFVQEDEDVFSQIH